MKPLFTCIATVNNQHDTWIIGSKIISMWHPPGPTAFLQLVLANDTRRTHASSAFRQMAAQQSPSTSFTLSSGSYTEVK
jgi:hypothetical protein